MNFKVLRSTFKQTTKLQTFIFVLDTERLMCLLSCAAWTIFEMQGIGFVKPTTFETQVSVQFVFFWLSYLLHLLYFGGHILNSNVNQVSGEVVLHSSVLKKCCSVGRPKLPRAFFMLLWVKSIFSLCKFTPNHFFCLLKIEFEIYRKTHKIMWALFFEINFYNTITA